VDDERERGRVNVWRVRLDKTLAFAERLVPVFDQMHREARPTLRSYADWLNGPGHIPRYGNEKGRKWRAETVSRLFSIDQRARDLVEKCHDRNIRRLEYLKKSSDEVRADRAAYLERSEKLAVQLRGPWRPDRD